MKIANSGTVTKANNPASSGRLVARKAAAQKAAQASKSADQPTNAAVE